MGCKSKDSYDQPLDHLIYIDDYWFRLGDGDTMYITCIYFIGNSLDVRLTWPWHLTGIETHRPGVVEATADSMRIPGDNLWSSAKICENLW